MADAKKKKDGQVANGKLDLIPSHAETYLDPYLQKKLLPKLLPPKLRTVLDKKVIDSGWETSDADASTLDKSLDVIARLKAPGPVDDLVVSRQIAPDLVTGTVQRRHIEAVRHKVASLKAVLPLHFDLMVSVPAVHCSKDELKNFPPPSPQPLDGSGVIVGIVDRGCDFRHRNFRRASGETRLLYLWDQRRDGHDTEAPSGYDYGRELDATRINHALDQPDPYEYLDYQLEVGAHGTHVMDIAAGSGAATGLPGVAPGADLIFVDLKVDAEERHGTLGNSRHLLEAVDYIFAKAKVLKRPAVVNLSLGMHSGPHDGTTLVEQGFERLLSAADGRAIVVAAGNANGQSIHVNGTVPPGETISFDWEIAPDAPLGQECEIWYDGGGEGAVRQGLKVTLESPDGQLLAPVGPGETRILVQGGVPMGYVLHRYDDPNNHDNHIVLVLPSPADPAPGNQPGAWHIKLENPTKKEVGYHAWAVRDDFGHSKFPTAIETHTLGAICCGASTLTVGAFDAHLPGLSPFPASGVGPIRKVPAGQRSCKPEVVAPGAGVVAASSRSSSSLLQLSGTSAAAPHVTGLVALLFQAAGPLSTAKLRTLITSAASLPGTSSATSNQLGCGRIDGVRTLGQVLPKPRPPSGAALPVATADGNGHASNNGLETSLQRADLVAALQKAISHLSPTPPSN